VRGRRPGRIVCLLTAVAAVAAGHDRAAAQISPGPLAEAHADLDDNGKCLRCHVRGSASMNERCLDCHREIGWLQQRGRGLHAAEGAQECLSCHPDHGGRSFALIDWGDGGIEGFDHRRAGWSLEGKHGALKCSQCHRPELQTTRMAELFERKEPGRSWLGLETACLACHQDQHGGALGPACETCHTNLAWKPAAGFRHEQSSFPLTGKHESVACDKCHFVPQRIFARGPEGGPVPRYKPLAHAECSDCHRDVHEGRLGPKCGDCHVTADFGQVGRERFDHSRTRFVLRGAHVRLDCAKCHDSQRAWGKRPPFDRCDSCHRDAHAGTATRGGKIVDCGACHTESAFKPSVYRVADHASSRYPLEGKHREVVCDRCHQKRSPGVDHESLGTAGVLLRPAYAACRDCHEDSHGGQLDDRERHGACEGCHRVEGWKPSTYGADRHRATRLELAGRHAEIDCADCHGPVRKKLPPLTAHEAPGKARVALSTLSPECVSCHHDPHRSRFATTGARPEPEGCLGCHRLSSFRPATVDAKRHDRFGFRLEGGHRAVPCVDCHEELSRPAAETRTLLFEERHERCADCHNTPHGGQFRDRPDRGRCDGCHDLDSFRRANRFDHERDAAFALRGGHQGVPCERCHPMRVDDEGRSLVVYRPIEQKCRDCHGPSIPEG